MPVKIFYPVELEALYRHNSLISEICVVGMSTDNLFEAAHAVIVPIRDDNRDRVVVEKAIPSTHSGTRPRFTDISTPPHSALLGY